MVPEHAHGRLRIQGPAVGALCLWTGHIGVTVALHLRLGIATLVEVDCSRQVSQLGQFYTGAVTPSAKGRGAGACWTRI